VKKSFSHMNSTEANAMARQFLRPRGARAIGDRSAVATLDHGHSGFARAGTRHLRFTATAALHYSIDMRSTSAPYSMVVVTEYAWFSSLARRSEGDRCRDGSDGRASQGKIAAGAAQDRA
jgi:hypothetical protein